MVVTIVNVFPFQPAPAENAYAEPTEQPAPAAAPVRPRAPPTTFLLTDEDLRTSVGAGIFLAMGG